jgi:hypothetical protein
VLPGTESDSIPTLGASTSGFAAASIAVGPRELYVATVSSLRLVVPMCDEPPTVSTQGALPGAVTPP